MKLDFLKPKSVPIVGVDISSSAVKMVELSRHGKSYMLERYVIEALPKDAMQDGNILNQDAVSDTLRKAWRKLGSRIKGTCLALPASAVITKKISLPATQNEVEMEMQVESEANQYVPFPLDEVNLDFQVLGESVVSPDEQEILLAAARKEKVEDRVEVIEMAGLRAEIMDVESFATQAAYELMLDQLPKNGAGQVVALVDIGEKGTHLLMFRDGQQLYSRDIVFGGHNLTNDIHKKYSLSLEEAEASKKKGGLPDSYELDVLQPHMDSLAEEIKRGIQFFFTSTQFNKVDHLLLAGGACVLPGLDEVVANRTQVSTMLANPFLHMGQSPRVKGRQFLLDAPALLTACGLALRRFD